MASRPQEKLQFAQIVERQPVREQTASEVFEDTNLVVAARDGDREAFGRLYDRYARMVHGVLLAKIPVSDVDDLVQDVFILALRRLSSLREPGSFGAWLAAIARNRAADYHRRAIPEDPMEDETLDQGESGKGSERHREHQSENQEGRAALDMLRTLPDVYRETLILPLVEGMTGPEIAARTGMTHGSVRVNLHRGMQQLRAKLSLLSGRKGTEEGKA